MAWSKSSSSFQWQVPDSEFQLPYPNCFAGLEKWKFEGADLPELETLLSVVGASEDFGSCEDDSVFFRENNLAIEFHYNESRPTGYDFKVKEVATGPASSGNPSFFNLQWCFSANTRRLDESLDLVAKSVVTTSEVNLLNLNKEGKILGKKSVPVGGFSADLDFFDEFGQEVSDPGLLETKDENPSSLIDRDIRDCWALSIKIPNKKSHLLLAAFPGDVTGLSIKQQAGGSVEIGHNLSFGFLEKGVIRRARFFVALVGSESPTVAELENKLVSFYRSKLPLEV